MSITIAKTYSKDKTKIWYKLEWGRGRGQRITTGIYTYVNPKNSVEKNHNQEAMIILEMKRSQMILESQAIATGYIPRHKYQANFFDFYETFVANNKREANRHLECSLSALRKFHGKNMLHPIDIDENFSLRFRQYLLDRYNGETPSSYFAKYKRVLKSAAKSGYFKISPAEDLAAKSNKNFKIKEILEIEDYKKLLNTPCSNYEVQKAFIVSLYSGFRWIDVKPLDWNFINDDTNTFRITQRKTKVTFERPLHEIARKIMGERKSGLVFQLPTHDGANKVLRQWTKAAGLHKHITWHCARHSFSVLLQDEGVDDATVAGMLGHTSTKFVHTTYSRYRNFKAKDAIQKLPKVNIR